MKWREENEPFRHVAMLSTTGDSLGQLCLEERWLSSLCLAESPSRKHYHIPLGLTPAAGLAACWSLRIL